MISGIIFKSTYTGTSTAWRPPGLQIYESWSTPKPQSRYESFKHPKPTLSKALAAMSREPQTGYRFVIDFVIVHIIWNPNYKYFLGRLTSKPIKASKGLRELGPKNLRRMVRSCARIRVPLKGSCSRGSIRSTTRGITGFSIGTLITTSTILGGFLIRIVVKWAPTPYSAYRVEGYFSGCDLCLCRWHS